jgi:hypothetical protein
MKKIMFEKTGELPLLELSREEMATIQGGESLFYTIGHFIGKLIRDGASMTNELGMTAYDVAL